MVIRCLSLRSPGSPSNTLMMSPAATPPGHPAREVDADDRAALVAGEEAALPLQRAGGDDVLVPVARQQAEVGGRGVRGQLAVRPRPDLGLDPDLEPQPLPDRADRERHDVVLVAPDDLACPRLVIGKR